MTLGEKYLRKWVYQAWSLMRSFEAPWPADVRVEEGRILHFDFTYQVVGGIWVYPGADEDEGAQTEEQKQKAREEGAEKTDEQKKKEKKNARAELSYVLGSVFGSTGVVLAAVICATEKSEHIKSVFTAAFQRTGVPPQQIWVDDVGKWGGLLRRQVEAHFGPGHVCKVGQDWRHFKVLLLNNLDKRLPWLAHIYLHCLCCLSNTPPNRNCWFWFQKCFHHFSK